MKSSSSNNLILYSKEYQRDPTKPRPPSCKTRSKLQDYSTSINITPIYERLTKNDNKALNWLCRKYSVRCSLSSTAHNPPRQILHLVGWKESEADKAIDFLQYLETYKTSPWLLDVDLWGLTQQRPAYLFIDGSNISAAIRNRFHIDVDYPMILDAIAFECPKIVHKEVIESFLSHHVDRREEMWDDLGIMSTILPARPGEKEEIIDEMLHEAMLREIEASFLPGHLILLSGDGNWNQHYKPKKDDKDDGDDEDRPSSFPLVVEKAIQAGWSVDVWSVKHSCSKTWIKFEKKYAGKFRLRYINPLLRDCVFPMEMKEAKSMAHLAKKRCGHMESILFPPESYVPKEGYNFPGICPSKGGQNPKVCGK